MLNKIIRSLWRPYADQGMREEIILAILVASSIIGIAYVLSMLVH
jgi:hypothetical protein